VTEGPDSTLLERYRRLSEISRDLASTLDLDVLLNRIVQAAADLSHAEAASILLYDESKQQLFFQVSTNLDEPLMRGLVVPVEGSIAGLIVTNRQPIILSEAQKDPRHFSNIAKITKVTTNSLLGVPLIAKDKVIGALEAINKLQGEFTEEDQHILMDLGAQAAVAIETARLFQQSDLIAEMVHELRTPLSSLRTAAHLLTRQDVSPEKREQVVQIMHTETTRLTEMTTAFLDLARLESGRMQLQAQRFDLIPLLEECVQMMCSKAEVGGLELQLTTLDTLPPLKADRDKIKQVVLNLISNAIKYNRPNGQISISAESTEGEIMIVVSDTGSGIRETDLAHLFEKFYRARAAEKSTTGTGLGLAISKRIIEMHGGHIEVHTQVGQGTSFFVHLPALPG
jgi:signal transduction histidine kinase